MTEILAPRENSEPWDVFVLATCARLGPFSQVHLAPKLTSASLGVAVHANLPLEPGELLVAAVDNVLDGLSCPILLTTRRVFWFSVTDPKADGDRRKAIHCEGIDYRQMGSPIEARSTAGGTGLVVADGRTIALPDGQPALAAAMADAIQTLSVAARTGVAPSIEKLDPELARRIAGVLPKVVEANSRLRIYGGDLQTFRRDLMTATPKAFVTPTLIASCVAVFVAMVASGISPMTPTSGELLKWGANDAAPVVLGHEYWRLAASVFLHGGLLHLAVNMWCLANIGPLVERLYGNLGYAVVYLASGVGGAIASMATPPSRASVGASGAIFGVIGALLAFLLLRRRSVPSSVLAPLRSSAVSFVVFNTLFGAVVPMIDQSAHMGGLAAGFLVGLILSPSWPSKPSLGRTARTAALAVVAALVLSGVGAAAVHWRSQTLSPYDKVKDYGQRMDPANQKFLESAKDFPKIAQLLARIDEPSARSELLQLTESLSALGKTNLATISRVRSTAPELETAARLLESAQKEQIAAMDAAEQFEKTRDRAWLEGPDGFIARAGASVQHERECRAVELKFLRDNDLLDESGDPGP
ncbi:rhomboid family intramembrane serine protease [Paludisphaera borealis]|uniref:Rhomboid protease GluP n=1 Tax=Paludisphaera borealis TaxID=1387353 RepID=A0A1U7CPX2_9BACT|nr:rhomboid family intramembrane serine protease [Paludisphaera borealis]APW60958.1 Rhomboid protease GluP [Paludisphaera borealis]